MPATPLDRVLRSLIADVIPGRHNREPFDQQIYPLLGMDAAEEEQDALAMQVGE
jgi:hypothetical protein